MTAKHIAMTLVLLLVAVVVTLGVLRGVWQHRVGSRIRITSPTGIDSLEKIKLGGVDQWIQIRGHDRGKPILLFLHGGPGFPNMPFAHMHAELERAFVVVQWDQRAAGNRIRVPFRILMRERAIRFDAHQSRSCLRPI